MANSTSFLQISGQLQAQADRLTSLVANGSGGIPDSASQTLIAAIGRAIAACQSMAALPADIAKTIPAAHSAQPGAQAGAIAQTARTLTSQRVNAANAALAALDGEAATVVRALDARFSINKPASLSDTLLVRKADQLQALFESQGGNSPALLLSAVCDRLMRALDAGDTATAYVITSELDDWRATMGIDAANWDATIANAMQARTVDDPQNEASAALYAALTRGGPGGLQEFVALAQSLVRNVSSATMNSQTLAHERNSW